ncbi:MAG: TSUP family transporter [Francisellaceae bacterium]
MALGISDSLHYAITTGLAIAALTASSSLYRYMKETLISKTDIAKISPVLLISNVGGVAISMFLPQYIGTVLFVMFIVNVCVTVVLPCRHVLMAPNLSKMSSWVGFQSGVIGVSGGSAAYSYWLKSTGDCQKAAAISALITCLIASLGAVAGLVMGIYSGHAITGSFGFLYWPAVLLVAPFSMLSTPIGIRLNKCLPHKLIRIIFIATMLLCAVMLLAVE